MAREGNDPGPARRGGGGGGGGRGGAPPVPLDINAQGEIAGLPNSAFSGRAASSGAILAESPVCQECIVRQMFRYSYGRLETAADEKTIDQIFDQFKGSGFKFKNLLIALVAVARILERMETLQ